MLADPAADGDLRGIFQNLLNVALTRGRAPSRLQGLGPATLAAIDMVAADHPDAEADTIAAAYDAFDHEHGGRISSAPLRQDELSGVELRELGFGISLHE